MWYKNITGRFFGLVTKHACDGQTDRRGQNYDSQDRASIAASRGKNVTRLCSIGIDKCGFPQLCCCWSSKTRRTLRSVATAHISALQKNAMCCEWTAEDYNSIFYQTMATVAAFFRNYTVSLKKRSSTCQL